MAEKKDISLQTSTISDDLLVNKIYLIRGQKVMIDNDLAELYGVETKQLKRQVRRNMERFPEDFMFELSDGEYHVLRSQIGTLKQGGHSKYPPMAFTEQGVAMLSSVLNSTQAIAVNIQIMRIFTKIRQILMDNTDIRLEIEKIKRSLDNHDKNIGLVFQYLDELNDKIARPPLLPDRERVGFKIGE
ncbi:ORF6N domain-containing protein [Parapedobacter koreensis]|uniref:ORF6N domain-containing protein n=1 Tax=Parapedobacter koreensis TaxID=332977 RepID=A0A1H7UAH4_9SPHI|nr:ORF6N domain-containing protein [Parapedobacter koreensis]SEL94013.1 ORF6N domain-containing protein [Parapedobacter koreensis]